MPPCKVENVVTYLTSMISPMWASTLLLVVFLGRSAFLHIHIPPLKPSTAIQLLATSINEEIAIFDAHMRELGTFNSKLRWLKCKSLVLSRELRQADEALQWSDMHTWLRYISRIKKIWNDTHDNQRTVDMLQKCMQDVIFAVEEERSRAEALIAQRRDHAVMFDMSGWSYQDLVAA